MKRAIPHKSGAPRLISTLLVLQSVSIVGLFSTRMFPHLVQVVGSHLQNSITETTDSAAVIIAIALAMIARGIAYKRRRAWQLATVLQVSLIAMAIFHNAHRLLSHRKTDHVIFGNFGLTHLVFEIIVLALLLFNGKLFNTVTDPHTRKSDFAFFFRIASLSFLVATLIVYFDRDRFVQKLTLLQVFETSSKGLIGVSGPIAFSMVKTQERLENLMLGLGLFVAISTIIRLLRPVERIAHMSAEDKVLIADLIKKYPSEDSLAYFSLRDDKDVILSLIHI